MAAGATYEPISTTTLGSANNSVTFSSIPATYTDLIVVMNPTGVSSGGYVGGWRVNGDTGNNYSNTNLYGSGSAGSSRNSNTSFSYAFNPDIGVGDSNSIGLLHFFNYANTTNYKTVLTRYAQAGNGNFANVGLWRSTSAINSITLLMYPSIDFDSGSTFTLYGIAAA